MRNMEVLVRKIENLKNSNVRRTINARIKEFKKLGRGSNKRIFNELCFCIMTANFNAERSIKIQEKINNGFYYLPKSQLTKKLKILGHRFATTRGDYIVKARRYKNSLKPIMENFEDERALREWLVKNVKGLGYKEASHFLRNIGYENVAIIDFHIIDLLVRHKLIKRPKTLTRKKYLEIEAVLKNLAKKSKLNLAELDLYLWYMETGKVLK